MVHFFTEICYDSLREQDITWNTRLREGLGADGPLRCYSVVDGKKISQTKQDAYSAVDSKTEATVEQERDEGENESRAGRLG